MQSIHSVITHRFFKQALIPILIVELSLIVTLFALNHYQTEQHKQTMQAMARTSFREIAAQVSTLINRDNADKKIALRQLVGTAQALFELGDDLPVRADEVFYRHGFFVVGSDEKSSVYTTNIERLGDDDYRRLGALVMLIPALAELVDTSRDFPSAAWINIDKRYAVAYPPIAPEQELTPNLDVTQYPFYYLASPEYNPERTGVFVPLYTESWAVATQELGAFLMPIYVHDEFTGVIGLTLKSKAVETAIMALELPFGAIALITDDEHRLLSSSAPERTSELLGVTPFTRLNPDDNATIRSVDFNALNANHLVYRTPIADTHFELIIFADTDAVYADIDRISKRSILVGIVFTVGIALFYLFFFAYNVRRMRELAAKISDPLRRIVDFSSKLGRTEGVSLQPSDIEELSQLNANLNQTHEKLVEMVIRDDATGLYNRRKLLTDLATTQPVALMLLQLHNYNTMHNLYGQSAADAMIERLVERLCIPEGDMLYRIADDTFAITQHREDLDELYGLMRSITHTHVSYYSIDVYPMIFAGIGSTAMSNTDLFEQAGIALLQSQRTISAEPVLYRDAREIKQEFESNLSWSYRLNRALDEDRLVPYFQPILNLHTDEIDKCEALVRMIEGGEVISPEAFLQSAADTGKLHEITKRMLRKVIAVAGLYPDLGFNINLSFKDFLHSDLISFVEEHCGVHRVDPGRITFELLETEALGKPETVLEVIRRLKQSGFSIAIDDFGTGHSNFAHLMMMQVDYIKIDGRFVQNVIKDPNSAAITRTIAKFAAFVGAKSVAEYVVDEHVLKRIVQFEIDYAQGYVVAEPMSHSQLDEWLRARR